MSDSFPRRIIAEILTKETTEEKRAVLDAYDKSQREMWAYINERNAANLKWERDKRARFAAWPWWKRIGRGWWDVPDNDK